MHPEMELPWNSISINRYSPKCLVRCLGQKASWQPPIFAVLEKMVFHPDEVVVLNLSGRGDKDLSTYIDFFKLND